MTEPAIITCAIVGGGLRSENPFRPRTHADIVREAIGAAQAGATILHLHARDQHDAPTQDPAVYREMVSEIRGAAPDVVLNFTCSGSVGMADDERLRALEAEPDIGTIDCGSINLEDGVFATSPEFQERAAAAMRARGVRPELQCLEAGWIDVARGLAERGVVDDPPFLQLMLGMPGAAPARLDTLFHFAALVPPGAVWAGAAIGDAHFRILALALALGGHVRTGLEDVTRTEDGAFARSNAQLVERTRRLCEAVGRPVATPAHARRMLKLKALVPA